MSNDMHLEGIKALNDLKSLPWGDPPKPNLWKVYYAGQAQGVYYYKIESPLLKKPLALGFSVFYVSEVSGSSQLWEFKVSLQNINGIKAQEYYHTTGLNDLDYGKALQKCLRQIWEKKKSEIMVNFKNPNMKVASDLNQYPIDPRFVNQAPKKMIRTAGEVRFVKDNSNDASSWAWGDTGASERRIPADFVFKKNAHKALAKTMRSSLSAMGHALSAYHTFTKIKSADVSPDGALGGRGYIQKVAHMRRAYMNVAEALSALSDTIYDEINAPHWQDAGVTKEIKAIVEEAEEIREDPEAWAEEQDASRDEENIEEENP